MVPIGLDTRASLGISRPKAWIYGSQWHHYLEWHQKAYRSLDLELDPCLGGTRLGYLILGARTWCTWNPARTLGIDSKGLGTA